MSEGLVFQTIAALGAQFRSGTTTPRAAAQACLDRIARLDGRVNAFITVTTDLALRAADQVGVELRAGSDRGRFMVCRLRSRI